MKLALVTTPPSLASGIGDYTRHLLPELGARAEVSVFVDDGLEGGELAGHELRPIGSLAPRAFDQIVYQLGNEIAHAFMERWVRRLGGTVVLHDWVLFDLALAAHPALARGGAKGLALVLREGGLAQARVYLENGRERRRRLVGRERGADPAELSGTLLDGWHAAEPAGRWTSDLARMRLSGTGLESVRVRVSTEPGRRVELRIDARSVEAGGQSGARELELELSLRGLADPILSIAASPLFVSADQRRHGDMRALGAFVRSVVVRDDRGARELDLSVPAASPHPAFGLWNDRFRLGLNRSIVRRADAFLVHSEFLRARVLEDRNAPTPVGVVRHGAEARWSDEDRRCARDRLGLPAEWRESTLLTSFGGVQAHKRIAPLLHAFAAARRNRADLRLALIGAQDRESLDVPSLLRELDLEDCVRLTGRVAEAEAWTWIHAGDFAVQLRGPSTGGSSGGVFQSLSLGRAVIASDLDEQRELPSTCVLRVAPDAHEVESLARLFLELAGNPQRRAALERSARSFVEEECSWARVAEAYVQHLEAFPLARASRLPLWR